MPKVDVYSTAWCPFCVRAKMLLQQKGVTFTDLDVERDPSLRQQMVDRAPGSRTVPQIFIDDYHVGGCDQLFALERQGELDSLLNLD